MERTGKIVCLSAPGVPPFQLSINREQCMDFKQYTSRPRSIFSTEAACEDSYLDESVIRGLALRALGEWEMELREPVNPGRAYAVRHCEPEDTGV